ncbi:hypothetical protein [Roseobacter sp.]|uniref:hypothetical protein n=1 Tax=Roseobacter sp. TaxID=1907202 RepID=UPI003859AFE5
MVWAAASKIITKLAEKSGDKSLDQDGLIKRTFGLADTRIPIGREDEPAGYVRWDAQDNDGFTTGAITSADGTELKWREYLWQGPATIDECEWGTVRWRFYSNGLVCFDAKMSNKSGQLDYGDVQGHRIELREKNGLLLGVWIAGFFVRRDLPQRGFASSFVDTHEPLKLHFSEIDDQQHGAWVCL